VGIGTGLESGLVVDACFASRLDQHLGLLCASESCVLIGGIRHGRSWVIGDGEGLRGRGMATWVRLGVGDRGAGVNWPTVVG
jgi:hypothetical protein